MSNSYSNRMLVKDLPTHKAVSGTQEEIALLEFLLKSLPCAGNGGFKDPVFETAVAHLRAKLPAYKGAPKHRLACKCKWHGDLKRMYALVNDLGSATGWTWSDEHGCRIKDDNDPWWLAQLQVNHKVEKFKNTRCT
ncbi:hypothetical protein BKA82DRAFT_4021800 [Pisolithus tinctorius]|nr:hypothetical protein BKA82DRAFT_4021800 [Pisolithus tinctorius]